MPRVYLDHNATTPLRPQVLERMAAVLRDCYGNPSSVHWAGDAAREVLERARNQVAAALGGDPEGVVFTSSATESNNIVLRDAFGRVPARGDHVVTCATEHPSILENVEDAGEVRVTILSVGSDGRVDPEEFSKALTDRTLLASIMWANNETGVVQPIAELARRAAERGVLFHTDAVQALGKVPLRLGELPVDFASFSAHKLGGPKGSGALYVRPGVRFTPLLRGGGQERRRRAGTENVPGIAGFGAACEVACADLEERRACLEELRSHLWKGIVDAIPDAQRNGDPATTLSHTLNVSFPGADGEALVEALDLADIAVASGAACHSGSTEPSHVLMAMGVDPDAGAGAIRVSLGFDTTRADVDALLDALPPAVARVRSALRDRRGRVRIDA